MMVREMMMPDRSGVMAMRNVGRLVMFSML
jgi:hypothetical protein